MKDLEEVECKHLKCTNNEIKRVGVVRPSAERVDVTQPNDDLSRRVSVQSGEGGCGDGGGMDPEPLLVGALKWYRQANLPGK